MHLGASHCRSALNAGRGPSPANKSFVSCFFRSGGCAAKDASDARWEEEVKQKYGELQNLLKESSSDKQKNSQWVDIATVEEVLKGLE